MSLQSVAVVAKKLLVDDQITPRVKQIYLQGVICKVSSRKTFSGETFCFFEKLLLSIFKFCASSNLLIIYELFIGHNQLCWNVLLFSCNQEEKAT